MRISASCLLPILLLAMNPGSFARSLVQKKAPVAPPPAVGSLSGKINFTSASGQPAEGIALIYITGFNEAPPAPERVLEVRQKNKMFESEIMAITKGEKVGFLNDDSVTHNVFSVSKAKQFDLGNASHGESKSVTFDETGIVEVFCNIHPDMATTVFVLPNRAFAISSKEHKYGIANIPAGKYKAFAWSKLSKPQSQEILIETGKELNLDWTVQLTEKNPSHLKKDGQPYPKAGY